MKNIVLCLIIIVLCIGDIISVSANDEEESNNDVESKILITGDEYFTPWETSNKEVNDNVMIADDALIFGFVKIPETIPIEITDEALISAFRELQKQFPDKPPVLVWENTSWKGNNWGFVSQYYILPYQMRSFVSMVIHCELGTSIWHSFDTFGKAFDFVRKAKEQKIDESEINTQEIKDSP